MNNTDYNKRTIIKQQIDSIYLNKKRDLWIYLPPGYTKLQTYPVIYCQDGLEFLNYGRIATITNYLVLEEELPPPIIVGIEVDLQNRTQEYSPDGARHAAYCQFVVSEVVPAIERTFPVSTKSADRVLAGDSLGGTVSLHLALNFPELFQNVLSLSGAFLAPTLQRLANEEDLSWLTLYMLIGLQEDEVKTDMGVFDFLELNRQAKQLLELKGAKLTYREAEGRHIWGFWQKELGSTLRHFLEPNSR